MPDATIVITAHNAAHLVHRPLASLQGQPARILVVDDRSDDHLGDVLARHPGVQVVRLDLPPTGNCTARQAALDAGWQQVTSDCVLFLDADAVVPPGWVAAMVDALAGADVVSWPLACGTADERRWLADLQTADAGFYRLACRLLHATGRPSGVCLGALGVRRDWLQQIGGFSALGFTLTEDLALARATTARRGRLTFAAGPAVRVLPAPDWRSLVHRALRTSTTGGWSWLAVLLSLWVTSLPVLLVLALGGVVAWWVPVARWMAGTAVVAVGVAQGRVVVPWTVAAAYELAAFVTSLAVLRARRRHSSVEWGGLRYTLDPPGRAAP